MNHILFFVYAVDRKHTCIDDNLSGSWLVELELSFCDCECVLRGHFIAVLQILNCLIHSHQQRIPDRLFLRKKAPPCFCFSDTKASSLCRYHLYFLLIDTTKGAVRVRLSGSQLSVVSRGMRGGLQFIDNELA